MHIRIGKPKGMIFSKPAAYFARATWFKPFYFMHIMDHPCAPWRESRKSPSCCKIRIFEAKRPCLCTA